MKNKPHNRNSSKKKSKRSESTSLVLKSFLLILLFSIIIIGICLLVYILSFKHGDLAINLDDYKNNQNQTSIVYAQKSDGKEVEIARLHGLENRIWVEYDKIPQNLKDAFVALEDKRFDKHHGVDWKRTISSATIHHFSQGGSTITQQLIKNLTKENAPTIARKFNEILYALNLEENYSKKDVLEAYLNTIPLGSGCYGVQTASKTYFGKDVKDLNLAECAVLSCITKAPTKFNPLINPENNKVRQEMCLKMMYDQGYITESEYNEAKTYKLVYTNSKDYKPTGDEYVAKSKKNTQIQSYYVDLVVDTLIKDFMREYGYDKTEATRMIYYGGLKIHSCVNLDVQKSVDNVYQNRITFPKEPNRTEKGIKDKYGRDGFNAKVQSSMIIMDYKGRIVGIAGGAGPKTSNRCLIRAVSSKRQPGSSIKPLSAYAPAIEKNIIDWSKNIQDYAITLNGELWPQNYGGSHGDPETYVTVQNALARSLNTVPVRIIQKLGMRTSAKFLTDRFHLSTLILEGKHTDVNLSSLGVGGMSEGVTPLEMAAAFATFGNGGYYYKPYCYTKVTNSDGKKIYFENNSAGKRVLSSSTADVMNELLKTVMTDPRGTGRAYKVSGFETFAKTGTTTDNKDKWIVGGTPYYVAAVWYGYDRPEELKGLGGSNPAGKIFRTVMNPIHKSLHKKSFKKSGETVQKSYCLGSGLLVGEQCGDSAVGWYKKNHLPDVCTNCTGETEGTEDTTDESGESTTDTTSDSTTQTSGTTTTTNLTTSTTKKPE